MFATSGVQEVLGIEPEALTGKSFYLCIEENCLQDSVKCLESAKANDSIAYLRFQYRNPLQTISQTHSATMSDIEESDTDEDGGVAIPNSRSSVSMRDSATPQPNGGAALVDGVHSSDSVPQLHDVASGHHLSDRMTNGTNGLLGPGSHGHGDRSSSDQSMDQARDARDAIFDPPEGVISGASSTNSTPDESSIELEAVISCTSDGMVVVLRRAHELAPPILQASTPPYQHVFASPWASASSANELMDQSTPVSNIGFPASQDPVQAGLMAAIRDVAVFAWSLTGINGSLAQYAKGKPTGEAAPPGGLPVWDPNATGSLDEEYNGFSGSRHRPYPGMGDPAGVRDSTGESTSSSDDEVLWKVRPALKPPLPLVKCIY
jgi:hypothetical protein